MSEFAKVLKNEVFESIIKNCFEKAGCGVLLEIEEQDLLPQIQHSWEILHPQGHLADDILLNEFLTVNDKLCLADYPTDEHILSTFHETEKENEEPDEVNEYENISKP